METLPLLLQVTSLSLDSDCVRLEPSSQLFSVFLSDFQLFFIIFQTSPRLFQFTPDLFRFRICDLIKFLVRFYLGWLFIGRRELLIQIQHLVLSLSNDPVVLQEELQLPARLNILELFASFEHIVFFFNLEHPLHALIDSRYEIFQTLNILEELPFDVHTDF